MKKKLLIITLLLINQQLLMSQIVPNIWNENLNLKKEHFIWFEKTAHLSKIQEGNRIDYLFSKVEIGNDGKRKVFLYGKNGEIIEEHNGYFETEFIEIFEMKSGEKEVKMYDENENLISEIWMDADGSKDKTEYTYENGMIQKIVEKDEFGKVTEIFEYENKKIISIKSFEGKKFVMERKMLYDSEGKLYETQRIQEGVINKRTFLKYNDNKQLVYKEVESINRLTGAKMPPDIYECEYHLNGKLKEERNITYKDESKKEIIYETVSIFNELGLEIKNTSKDYLKNIEEVMTYEYKLK